MAEFLAAAGAAASILQLAAYAQTVVGRVFDFQRNVRETPKAFRNLHVTLPFIQSTAAKIKERAEAKGLDQATLRGLIPVLTQSQAKVKELNAIFRRTIPEPGSNRVKTFWKAVVSVSQDGKVEKIATDLMTFVHLLTLHASIIAPTAEEISSVVSADIEDVIDTRIRGIVLQLKETAPTSSVTHFNNNSNTYLTGSNQHSYYAGQTQITNNFYFNFKDGQMAASMETVQNAVQGRVPLTIAESSESHPVADFLSVHNDTSLPWNTARSQAAGSMPVPALVTPQRPRSAEPSYLERDRTNLPIYIEQRTAFYADFPEPVMASTSGQHTTGFIEPMDSTPSLAPSSSSKPSVSYVSDSHNSLPIASRDSHQSLDLSRSGTRASIRSVHSFNSLRPPQAGHFELDAPAAAVALSSSPRAQSFSSDGSRPPFSSIETLRQSDSGSEPNSDTTAFTKTEDAAIALESANEMLRFASKSIDSSSSQARQAYTQALSQYRVIGSNDATICVRKYRSMVNAELGLSLVVADQTKHLARAESHCSTAMEHARRSPNPGDVAGVKLDQAKVKARFARLQEKSPRSSILVIGAIHGEAFDLFQEAAKDLDSNCTTIDDFNSLAQALLGSARMAKKLSAFGVGDGRRKVFPPESYLRDAMERVGQGMRRGTVGEPAMDRLAETQEMVRRMLQAL